MTAQAKSVTFFAIAAPGTDPAALNIVPNVKALGWKFAEMSDAQLIDMAQSVDNSMAAMEKWVKAAREVLKTRLTVPQAPGEETVTRGALYEAHYTKSVRTDVDREKVKARLGDEYPSVCKSTEILTLKIVPIAATA